MSLFTDVVNKASEYEAVGGKEATKAMKIARLKFDNSSAESEIQKLYAKIGEIYYAQNGLSPESGLEAICDKITALKTVINANNTAINEVKIDGIVDDEVVDPE